MDDYNQEKPDDFLLNAAADSSSENDTPPNPPGEEAAPPPGEKPPGENPPEEKPPGEEAAPPPGENPPGENPPEDSFSFKEHFADHENVDNVKQLVSRGTKYTQEVEDELTQFRANKEQFETDQAALIEKQNQSPYEDERYYKLDQLKKTDPDLVPVYQKLMFGNPDPLEIIKQDLLIKHPDLFKDDPEGLKLLVEDKYPVLFAEDADQESIEYKNAYKRMQMDSKIVKSELMKKVDSIDVPNPEAATTAAKQKQDDFIKSWDPFIGKLKDSFVNIPVEINDEKGVAREKSIIDIPIPEKEQTDYLNQAARYIFQNSLEASEESLAKVTRVARALWIADNQAQYNTLIAKEMAAEGNKGLRSWINNPKTDFSSKTPPPPINKDGDDEAIKIIRDRDNQI